MDLVICPRLMYSLTVRRSSKDQGGQDIMITQHSTCRVLLTSSGYRYLTATGPQLICYCENLSPLSFLPPPSTSFHSPVFVFQWNATPSILHNGGQVQVPLRALLKYCTGKKCSVVLNLGKPSQHQRFEAILTVIRNKSVSNMLITVRGVVKVSFLQ